MMTELVYDVETDIMKNIIKYLRSGSYASAEWQIRKLGEYNALSRSNRTIIENSITKVLSATDDDIKEAARQALAEIDPIIQKGIKAGAIEQMQSPKITELLNIYQAQAKDGINLTMQTLLSNANRTYVNTVNRTALKLLSGVSTLDQSLAETVREWTKSGIPSIIDKGGRQWSTQSYAQMVLRTNIRTVTTEMQFARCDEYDVDLIEVSSHLDARPKCANDQGKIYSRSGRSRKYPAFGTTSYGDADGLFGVNCRHQSYPYIEGVSIKRSKPDPNTKTAYAESQEQRLLERNIRASKREVEMFKALGDDKATERAQATLRSRNDKMKSFLSETGRTRRSNREMIYA